MDDASSYSNTREIMTTGFELLALGGKAAGKISFSKLFSATLSKLSSGTKSALRIRNQEKVISKFYTQLSKVRLVKTLWQIDKAVDIGTFYCQSHVYVGGIRRKVGSLSDLDGLGNLLIEGIAGQGKSI